MYIEMTQFDFEGLGLAPQSLLDLGANTSLTTGKAPVSVTQLMSVGGPDIAGDATTTATIAIGETVTSENSGQGDDDWFAITLTAGQTIRLSADAFHARNLSLRDADGTLLAQGPSYIAGPVQEDFFFTATDTGVYYVSMRSRNNFRQTGFGEGEYSITLTEIFDDYADTAADADLVVPTGFALTGTLGDTDDIDAFNVQMQAGETLQLNLASVPGADDYINLFRFAITDETGTQVFNGVADELENAEFTAATSGVFTLTLEGFNPSYSNIGSYGDYTLSGQVIAPVNIMTGDASNDVLRGTHERDEISGLDGADRLYGYNGEDTLIGGAGDDWLFGGGDNDTLVGGSGADKLYGWTGDDTLEGGEGNDKLLGQDGNDTLNGGNGVDYLMGGNGNDILYGGADQDRLYGQNGDDEMFGGAGHDKLSGGQGNDKLFGDAGSDSLFGGEGNDNLDMGEGNDRGYGGAGTDLLLGGAGHDRLFGGGGNDSLNGGTGNDVLVGQNGDDFLNGNDGYDDLYGGEGSDYLNGAAGDDWLFGQAGSDTLFGDTGNDLMVGGRGNDLMTGGAGGDTFRFYNNDGLDTIADFEVGIDLIDMSRTHVDDFAELLSLSHQDGANVVITYGDNAMITLNNVQLADLAADDFGF